jgi:hypothetical protein
MDSQVFVFACDARVEKRTNATISDAIFSIRSQTPIVGPVATISSVLRGVNKKYSFVGTTEYASIVKSD